MEFIKKNKTILILLAFACFCLFFSTGHLANIVIDIGREIQYPLEILEGKVLYKDLFCIYGPLSYLVNALVYKVFGAKLTSLYLMGVISALLTVFLTYKISRKFLSDFASFAITFFIIGTGFLATRIFNFTLPYSYAVLYGLVCFLVSIYFLINFIENKKNSNLYISFLFGGFAASLKYDFILYIIPLFIVLAKEKNLKLFLKSLLCYFTALFLPFIILFFQGLQIKDLISAFIVIKDFTRTEALKSFYVTQGVYYTKRVWLEWLFCILFIIPYLVFLYLTVFLVEKKNKFLKILGVIIFLLTAHFLLLNGVNVGAYLFMTFLTFVLFVFSLNKNSYSKNIFILSALLISVKSLWGLSHVNYGLYYIGVVFISFFIAIENFVSKKVVNSICLLIILFGINFLVSNAFWLGQTAFKINTDKGNLYTLKDWGKGTNELLDFINETKEKEPFTVIFPEGLSINFLARKKTKTEGFYNSLIPLYVESFGEKRIINHFKQNPPDYITFSSADMKSYKQGSICSTYAFEFCNFVFENYNPVKKIEVTKDEIYLIFGKK